MQKGLTSKKLLNQLDEIHRENTLVTTKVFVDLSDHLPVIDHSDIPRWDSSDAREELIETIDELSRMYSEVVDKIEELSEDPAVSGIEYHPGTDTIGIKITDK